MKKLFLLFILLTSCVRPYEQTSYTGGSWATEPYVRLDRSNTEMTLWGCTNITKSCSLTYSAIPEVHNPLPHAIWGILTCEYKWDGKIIKKINKEITLSGRSSIKVIRNYTTVIFERGEAGISCYYGWR